MSRGAARPSRSPACLAGLYVATAGTLTIGSSLKGANYPNYKTIHQRFQAWCRDEILRRLLTDIANEPGDRGALDEEEWFIYATFVMAGPDHFPLASPLWRALRQNIR